MTLSAPDSCKVYTPQSLADAIVNALGDESDAHWLEPSVGTGVFLSSLSNAEVEPHRIVALDLDFHPGPQDHLADTLRGQDFLRWSLSVGQMFDRIVGNPPYITLGRLAPELREAISLIRTPTGKQISLKVNYWYAFVCACLELLEPDGCIGLVLPASWDYADYCADLREDIPKLFERFEVHRSLEPLFDDVGEGSIVILGYGYKKKPKSVQRFEHQNLSGMVAALTIGTCNVVREHMLDAEIASPIPGETCFLQDIAEIHIGAVTGDAKYFLLTESQRCHRKLPIGCCKPILTRSHHLTAGETSDAHWMRLKDQGERVWIFAPPQELRNHPSVEAYINLPQSEGGCNKSALWVNKRHPWFEVKLPEKVDGYLSGMARTGPWICVDSSHSLTASNTLYTIKFHKPISRNMKYAWCLSMLTSYTYNELVKSRRFYADGLVKHEPKDLNRLKLLKPVNIEGVKEYYIQTVDLLLSNHFFQARRRADEWFSRNLKSPDCH